MQRILNLVKQKKVKQFFLHKFFFHHYECLVYGYFFYFAFDTKLLEWTNSINTPVSHLNEMLFLMPCYIEK